MHEESNSGRGSSKISSSHRQVPSLSIPDPTEAFKLDSIYRPPSVPVLGRRLISESILRFNDDKLIQLAPGGPFRKYRRKSIPGRLEKKHFKSKKIEPKLKNFQKDSEIAKPLLNKSNKLIKIKSGKLLVKKNNFSTPHLRKSKKALPRACLVTPELISKTPEIKKSVICIQPKLSKIFNDKKDSGDEKKSTRLKKENFKHEEALKDEKFHKIETKISKSALSVKTEDKKRKKNTELKKNKIRVLKTNETPTKQRNKLKNQNSSSQILVSKINVIKNGQGLKIAHYPKPPRKKSKEKDLEKKLKNSSQIKILDPELKRPIKKKSKHKPKKKQTHKTKPEEWLDQSFFVHKKNDDANSIQDVSKCSDNSSRGKAEHKSKGLQALLSFEQDNLNIEVSSIPVLSVVSKKTSNSYFNSCMSNPSESIIPEQQDFTTKKDNFRIIQKKTKVKDANKEKSAIKIQSWVRGFLVRKRLKDSSYKKLERSNSHIAEFHDIQDTLSEEDFTKIIRELQVSQETNEVINLSKENIIIPSKNYKILEKIDKEIEEPLQTIIKTLPQSNKNPKTSEITNRLQKKNSDPEYFKQDRKEIENFLNLQSLKRKKSDIEELRQNDLEKIQKLTQENGTESEIFNLFQDIINRRYEKINDMFDENIKAVQEALAQSVISDESSIGYSIDLAQNMFSKFSKENLNSLHSIQDEMKENSIKIFKAYENSSNSNTTVLHETPEPTGQSIGLSKSPEALSLPLECSEIQEIEPSKTYLLDIKIAETSKISPLGSSSIMWIDEVAMPSNIDFTDLIIDAAISELYEYLYDIIIQDLWVFTASNVASLTEDLILVMIINEIHCQIEESRKDYNQEAIISFINTLVEKIQDELVSILSQDFKLDPLEVLSDLQETEVGAGFEPKVYNPILNIEGFIDIIETQSTYLTFFNILLFDCINEVLRKLVWINTMPWANQVCPKKVYKNAKDVQKDIETKIIALDSVKSGTILYENIVDDNPLYQETVLKCREQGVIRMLTQEIKEDDGAWSKYELEETQAKLDLADMVLELSIEEIIEILID
jgi:IQ calmodulin-binding motif